MKTTAIDGLNVTHNENSQLFRYLGIKGFILIKDDNNVQLQTSKEIYEAIVGKLIMTTHLHLSQNDDELIIINDEFGVRPFKIPFESIISFAIFYKSKYHEKYHDYEDLLIMQFMYGNSCIKRAFAYSFLFSKIENDKTNHSLVPVKNANSNKGVVYLIKIGNEFKIGFSSDISTRTKTFKTSSVNVKLVKSIEGTLQEELRMHKQLKQTTYHIERELYDFNDENEAVTVFTNCLYDCRVAQTNHDKNSR